MKKILAIFILSLIAQQAQSSGSRNFLQPFKNFVGFVGKSFFARNFHSFKLQQIVPSKTIPKDKQSNFKTVIPKIKSVYTDNNPALIVGLDEKPREMTSEEITSVKKGLEQLESKQALQKIKNAPIKPLIKRYYQEDKANPNNGKFTIRPINEEKIEREDGRTFIPAELQSLLAEANKVITIPTAEGYKLGGEGIFNVPAHSINRYIYKKAQILEKQNKANESDSKFRTFQRNI